MAGRYPARGWGLVTVLPAPRLISASALLHEHLVLVREDELMGLEVETLKTPAALLLPRVCPEQPHILHQLDATQRLEYRVDLAEMDRTSEWPAPAVGSAADRVEVRVERLQRLLLQTRGVGAAPRPQAGHHRETAVEGRLHQDARPDHPALVQPALDPVQGLIGGHPLPECKPATAAGDRGHDEDADPTALLGPAGGRQTADPDNLRRRLSRQVLIVLSGHGATQRPEQEGPSDLGVLDLLPVDSAARRSPVLDLPNVGDGRLEDSQRAPRHVARGPASGQIARHSQLGALLGRPAVAAHAPVR